MLQVLSKRRAVDILVAAAVLAIIASSSPAGAGEVIVWDIALANRLDSTNKQFEIIDGRVTVEIGNTKSLCPSGLGDIASGRPSVNEIAFLCNLPAAGDYVLKVVWNPGGQGSEQFDVAAGGKSAGKSALVKGEDEPYRDRSESFRLKLPAGANEIRLRHLSGDGLGIKDVALLRETGKTPGETSDGPASEILWDMEALGRFDRKNTSYDIVNGRVTVNIVSGKSACPSGLGHLATGKPPVQEVVIIYKAGRPRECWLHVIWSPGASGLEQFEVLSGGLSAGKSDAVNAALAAYEDLSASFRVPVAAGENELVLKYLSGDGMRIANIVLSTGPAPPSGSVPPSYPVEERQEAGAQAEIVTAPPTGDKFKPDLKYQIADAYSRAIGEPAVLIDGEHVAVFAPKKREREASIVAQYLSKAYDELHKIVGVHTKYKIAVLHFPKGSAEAFGGTSECCIWYDYGNLEFEKQEEWTRFQVPHVSGYIEEMAHNFVSSTRAQFGWEMVGWSIGAEVAEAVAANPVHKHLVYATRMGQSGTYWQYRNNGNKLPKNVPANQVDRIHAYILWKCQEQYGPAFWPDFFAEVRKERARLANPGVSGGDDVLRNARYRITIECFDRLRGLRFKDRLRESGISLDVDVKSLHPTDPGWNRMLQ